MTSEQELDSLYTRLWAMEVSGVNPGLAVEWARQYAKRQAIVFVEALRCVVEELAAGRRLPVLESSDMP